MKRIILSLLILLFMNAVVMADEIRGSIKIGIFQNETKFLNQLKITMVEAIQIAQKQLEGHVTDAEVDKEDGYLVYSIEVTSADGEEREVIIDPITGEVLEKDAVD